MDGPTPGQQVAESWSDLPDGYMVAPLAEVDPQIHEVFGRELERQRNTLEMIASENFVPQAVLEAVDSVLTNRYAEGYPGKRYYGGCHEAYHVSREDYRVDMEEVERLAHEHKPKLIVAGWSAYPHRLDFACLHGNSRLGGRQTDGGGARNRL